MTWPIRLDRPERASASVDRIKSVVAADYGVSVAELSSDRKDKRILVPRHVAIYLACRLTPLSRSVIGRLFGRRDHSTVWNAEHKIAARRQADVFLNGRLLRLESELVSPPPRAEVQLALFDGPLFDCQPRELAA